MFVFPSFHEPTPLGGGRSWTATFDSYDQRNDDVYYALSIVDRRAATVDRFLVRVDVSGLGDDWIEGGFVDLLGAQLRAAAHAGRTNII